MSAAFPWVQLDRVRLFGLWLCLALFALRVIGQIEVLLLAPAWLPPLEYWYSGLLPYPVLLPAQIALLMLMAVIAAHETRGPTKARAHRAQWQGIVRGAALCYFLVMLLRLVVQLARGAENALAAGGIPIAFHWILALYLLLLGRPTSHEPRAPRHERRSL